ncbi:MAG: exosortase-dependent surface protein XDP1 [Halioglobus sp.]
MSFKAKTIGAALALSLSAGAHAGVQTWDFTNPPQFDYHGAGNSWTLTQDGVTVKVTGWSDTWDSSYDDEVEAAQLIWAQSDALGIVNDDEGTSSPSHAIDSFRTGNDHDGDSDMLLLEFDTAVDLQGIDLSWARNGHSYGNADVSILAWDGAGDMGIDGKTWSDVLASNGGGYVSTDNANVGLNYYGVNAGNFTSTKWLIGVYNPVFGTGGSAGNDAFKLDSIRTNMSDNPPTGDVPVPGSLALVLLGLAGLRRKFARS